MARKHEKPLMMLGGLKKLSSTELQFMQFIWQYPEGISSEAIYQNFSQARGTKSTILYNISEKGYVQKVQAGLHHIYQAKVSEETYNQALIQQEMEKLMGESSFERLVAAFCGTKKLNESQKKRVETLLKELKEEIDNE